MCVRAGFVGGLGTLVAGRLCESTDEGREELAGFAAR
jgi:hypothetical protein